jgi:hypothetical protein
VEAEAAAKAEALKIQALPHHWIKDKVLQKNLVYPTPITSNYFARRV